MIIDIDRNVFITICFIVFLSVILYMRKPHLMFDRDGDFKQFGTGPKHTLYPVWLVVMVSSIILYVYLISNSNKFV